jgi:hypothetical protein
VPKRKVVPSVSIYIYEKFGEIWTSGRSPIRISKCGCLKILINTKMLGPTCQSQAPLKRRPDAGIARARQLRGRCHYLVPKLSTGRHVRSTRIACSRRPVRHLIALSVRRRSHFSSSHDSRRTPIHSTLLSLSASAPS